MRADSEHVLHPVDVSGGRIVEGEPPGTPSNPVGWGSWPVAGHGSRLSAWLRVVLLIVVVGVTAAVVIALGRGAVWLAVAIFITYAVAVVVSSTIKHKRSTT